MTIPIRFSTARTIRIGPYISQTDGISAKTGLTLATLKTNTKISLNDGAQQAIDSGTAFTEDAYGFYIATLDTTDTGTLGRLTLASEDSSNYLPMWMEFQVVPQAVYDALYAGSGAGILANVESWLGTMVGTPATAGIPDVNAKNINNVATTSVTTINANQGTTQPVNFTGTGASALEKVDVTDIAAAAVATGTAQLGVNVVNIAGSASQGAAGYVGLDWAQIHAPTTVQDLSGTKINTTDNAVPATLAASQPNYAPAKAGDAMTLTSAYDAAKTAASQAQILSDATPFPGADVAAIKIKTDHLPDSDIVNTSGKLWVLDGSGNAVMPASAYIAPLTSVQTAQAVLNAVAASYDTAGTIGAAINAAGSGGSVPTVQQIVDGVWDEPGGDHVIAATMGYLENLIAVINAKLTPTAQFVITDGFDSKGTLHLTQYATYSIADATQLQTSVVVPIDPTGSSPAFTFRINGVQTNYAATVISYDSGTNTATFGLELTSVQTGALPAGQQYNFSLGTVLTGSAGNLIPVNFANGVLVIAAAGNPGGAS